MIENNHYQPTTPEPKRKTLAELMQALKQLGLRQTVKLALNPEATQVAFNTSLLETAAESQNPNKNQLATLTEQIGKTLILLNSLTESARVSSKNQLCELFLSGDQAEKLIQAVFGPAFCPGTNTEETPTQNRLSPENRLQLIKFFPELVRYVRAQSASDTATASKSPALDRVNRIEQQISEIAKGKLDLRSVGEKHALVAAIEAFKALIMTHPETTLSEVLPEFFGQDRLNETTKMAFLEVIKIADLTAIDKLAQGLKRFETLELAKPTLISAELYLAILKKISDSLHGFYNLQLKSLRSNPESELVLKRIGDSLASLKLAHTHPEIKAQVRRLIAFTDRFADEVVPPQTLQTRQVLHRLEQVTT